MPSTTLMVAVFVSSACSVKIKPDVEKPIVWGKLTSGNTHSIGITEPLLTHLK